MANNANVNPALAERADIHKSCKSLETLLNVLNDYCEAAGAVVTLQKKLAKALRDTAGLKVTGDIPTNAMNASATIFDILSEIDSKYAKIADKEYDTISAEVKKWFKKLAREEKAHDERMANANTRIKQAGQAYEKKSKKKAIDAAEEHTRYFNLISSLGPEISQENYNHALSVTQRHTIITYNVAATLSRIADAEWLRTCEGVRRFSSTVGQLSEWRVLCEGSWTGPVPQDLPDIDAQPSHISSDLPSTIQNDDDGQHSPTSATSIRPNASRESTDRRYSPGFSSTEQGNSSREHLLTSRDSASLQRPNHFSSNSIERLAPPSSFDPPRLLVDPNTGSVRSLSAFPTPPTHFPIPPARLQQLSSLSRTSQPSPPQPSFPGMSRLTESPTPENDEHSTSLPGLPSSSPTQHRSNPDSASPSSPRINQNFQGGANDEEKIGIPESPNWVGQGITQRDQIESMNDVEPHGKSDYLDDGSEFGVLQQNSKARTLDGFKSNNPEHVDTHGKSGSIVAAMRNRYSSSSVSPSPTTKDILRLPLSVNDLATRYYPAEGTSSLVRPLPPLSNRQFSLPPLDTQLQPRIQSDSRRQDYGKLPVSGNRFAHDQSNDYARAAEEKTNQRRQHQLDEATILQQRETELREREREIEHRAQELERDRARLVNLRDSKPEGSYNDASVEGSSQSGQMSPRALRDRHPSFPRMQRPISQTELSNSTLSAGSKDARARAVQYSQSTTHLVPPSNNQVTPDNYPHERYRDRIPSQASPGPHAPYCGCEICSIAKYRTSSSQAHSPTSTSTAGTSTTEKHRGGWIRRLSMPSVVGNAFNLDSSKRSSGILSSGSIAGGKRVFSDGKKNASSTTLLGNVQEDGRVVVVAGRKSYESGEMGHNAFNPRILTGKR